MSKHFYWVVAAEVLDDGTVKWDFPNGFYHDYENGFPYGTVLTIPDDAPHEGTWDFVRDDTNKLEEITMIDLQDKLSIK